MGNLLERVRDRLVHRSQVSKRKLDAAFLRRELDRKLQDLGEGYSSLAREGKLVVPDSLAALVAEVRRVEKELEAKQAEIAQLEKEGAIES